MSKNSIATLLALIFLAGAVGFSYYQKQEFKKRLLEIKQESTQIEQTVALRSLWSAKGMQKKIKAIVNKIPKAKQERFKITRGKADIKLNSLSQRELNTLLSKLAMLPLRFKSLSVVKSGNAFILEIKCVW